MMNNVPKGHKQTEMGVIPEDWEVVYLGEMTTKVGSGITPTGGERVYKKDGRPFLRSQNVGWGNLLMEDIAYIDDSTHETFKDTEILKNDVFLNITGASIGRSAVADSRIEGGNVNQHVCIIRTVKDKLYPHFLNYFLLSKTGQKQIDSFQAGGNRQGLNFGQIRSFKIPHPPTKTEQIAIANALGDADALISSLKKLIAKKRNIKQGAMQQLLTGKKRLSGFSGKWEVKKLGEESELITKGTTPTSIGKDFKDSGINFIKIESLEENGNIIKDRIAFIDSFTNNLLNRSQLKSNDILISIAGALGRVAIVKDDLLPANTNQALAIVRLNKEFALNIEFLFYFLNSNRIKRHIEAISVQGAQANLSLQNIYDLPIEFPNYQEQTAIAQILSDMNAEIEALEQRLAKYRMIKQGMMQELLTGKTRLI